MYTVSMSNGPLTALRAPMIKSVRSSDSPGRTVQLPGVVAADAPDAVIAKPATSSAVIASERSDKR
jgi:hypothetical protein